MPSAPYFYPRPPRGGRLDGILADTVSVKFLSTPSARRATPRSPQKGKQVRIFLSTPSARRATRVPEPGDPGRIHFYPRPPRGGRLNISGGSGDCKIFLSTPSARRATISTSSRTGKFRYFYPRPPRGGRLWLVAFAVQNWDISIHALREEGDSKLAECVLDKEISIHALREEGDDEGGAGHS